MKLSVFCISLSLVTLAGLAAAKANLRINEILAVNVEGPEDKDGDLSAWVEFHNDSDAVMDLKGWHLTDDPEDLTKWVMPRKSVPAKGYAVVFLSGKAYQSLFSTEIHSTFKLSLDTDYLALVAEDGVTLTQELKDIPRQRSGISYGLSDTGEAVYFTSPTPGEPNKNPLAGFVSDTKFSVDRGFFTEAFEVEITTSTPDAKIIYTTSGREPSKGSIFTGPIEHVYDGPIRISETTVLRAAAFKDGLAPSNIDTQTYIFTADVVKQNAMRTSVTESPEYAPRMEPGLRALPSLSVAVEDRNKLANGTAAGNDDEYPISLEWLNPDGTKGFQIESGMSRFGGYYTNFPKKSFRVYFRKRFGAATLKYPIFRGFEHGIPPAEEFDSFNLRSGSHDMSERGAYMSNRFVDDSLLDMGNVAPHGRFVHLYINGAYWGQYHLRERWNAALGASYFGGKEEDYDAVNGNDNFTADFKAYDGDLDYWREGEAASRNGSAWEAVPQYVDIKDYFDFMLVWISGDSESEFQAVGSRTQQAPFIFNMKDGDGWLRRNSDKVTEAGPGRYSATLRAEGHPDFKIFLADLIHKHYFNDGAFSPEALVKRLQKRVDEVNDAYLSEAARWNFRSPSNWRAYQDDLLENLLPSLTKTMLDRFKKRGMYPDDIIAPAFSPQHGGQIDAGFTLKMQVGTIFNPQPGDLLFTLDGTDPRLPGGAVSPKAVTYDRLGPGVTLTKPVTVKSRLYRDNTWSALNEATYYIGKRPEPGDLVISEVHYRPAAPSQEEIAAGFDSRGQFEFVEIANASDVLLSLTEVAFLDGIDFAFKNGTITELAPGAVALVAANSDALSKRYGAGLPIAGEFSDSALSDSGESVRLSLTDGFVLQELTYNDKEPWPATADGDGPSLTSIDTSKLPAREDASAWRASTVMGGTPGRLEDSAPPTGEIDQDGDGLTAFIEEALGTSDTNPASGPDRLRLEQNADGTWTLDLQRNATITDVQFSLESSVDLSVWESDNDKARFKIVNDGQGDTLQWKSESLTDPKVFVRIRVSR